MRKVFRFLIGLSVILIGMFLIYSVLVGAFTLMEFHIGYFLIPVFISIFAILGYVLYPTTEENQEPYFENVALDNSWTECLEIANYEGDENA